MGIPDTRPVDLQDAKSALGEKRGIYFWRDKQDDALVYIGIAVGKGGLKRRIVQQHLNPAYLEYRPHKHTSKDAFQLRFAPTRISKKTGESCLGIDKSAFRKSIGRMLQLKPGKETVSYIMNNLSLEVFESEDVEYIRELEKKLIAHFQPKFNSAHKK
jgi:hypothetical protein